MLLQSLGALCKAPGKVRSIWKYLDGHARATGESARFDYAFQTELHFVNVMGNRLQTVIKQLLATSIGRRDCDAIPAQ